MFEQTFVDGTQKTRRPYTIALSLFVQILALGIVILIPLIVTQTLPTAQLKSMLVAPAPPPPPPPPPPPAPKVIPKPVVKQFVANQLLAPKVIPNTIARIEEAAPPPDAGVGVVGGTGDAGVAGGVIGGVVGGLGNAPPPPPPPKPKAVGPQRIGGNVMEAKLIRKVQPVYPPLAKSARVQGRVEFTATISKDGNIENLQLMSGHPLLVNAAREAVLQWRYQPTLLNGQPVEVITDIIVNFTLSQ